MLLHEFALCLIPGQRLVNELVDKVLHPSSVGGAGDHRIDRDT
ncbi:Uncharacterised protein [Mycobacteroides abscessus subsp. abscessus]|nr:Uncharacterised protein [Mycobacteroides abscessus subsp. abscessus]